MTDPSLLERLGLDAKIAQGEPLGKTDRARLIGLEVADAFARNAKVQDAQGRDLETVEAAVAALWRDGHVMIEEEETDVV